MPILIGVCVLAVIATRSQVGHYFEVKPLEWKLDKLNPVDGMKRVLPNQENTVKMLLVMGKVVIIFTLVYFFFRSQLHQILILSLQPVEPSVVWLFKRAALLILQIMGIFIALAVIDFLFKRKQYLEKLMMSRRLLAPLLLMPQPSVPVCRSFSEAPTVRTFLAVPGVETVLLPGPLLAAVKITRYSWLPKTEERASRTMKSYSCDSTV